EPHQTSRDASTPLDMTKTPNSRIRPAAKFFFEQDKKFFVKGVTYGPFKPDADGNYLGRPEQVEMDLALMRQVGLNLVRIYHAPLRWFFFFSSRRRHTSSDRDWSSDVCSSDLFWERRLPRLYAAIHCRLPAGFVAY